MGMANSQLFSEIKHLTMIYWSHSHGSNLLHCSSPSSPIPIPTSQVKIVAFRKKKMYEANGVWGGRGRYNDKRYNS